MKSIILLLFISSAAWGQFIGTNLPKPIKKTGKFIFYLHGGVVTELGDNAINPAAPEWGPYQYSAIIDSLRKRGFNVISEIRKKNVPNSFYTSKISKQVDSLLRAGVTPKQILVLGASAGWDITLRVSAALKNKEIRYTIMGGCWPDTDKQYADLTLNGHFLSIIEASDPRGTCTTIFDKRNLSSFKEIKLNTGKNHGFIYKGYREWIDPVVDWFGK